MLDSELDWGWNDISCRINAQTVCKGPPASCPSPVVGLGTYTTGKIACFRVEHLIWLLLERYIVHVRGMLRQFARFLWHLVQVQLSYLELIGLIRYTVL